MITTKHFNDDLYRKIREAKKEKGETVANLSEEIENHEMKGKRFLASDDGKIYTVKAVYKQFFGGFFELYMFIDENGSSRPSYMKNITSVNQVIIDSIEENKKIFSFFS